MLFISSSKLFSFLKYLNFCLEFFDYVRKLLDKKTKVKFKSFDVSNWDTINHNKHITRYHKK